jgi:beta-phosphoglucomutase-like phosphatase (HAD superfamily)
MSAKQIFKKLFNDCDGCDCNDATYVSTQVERKERFYVEIFQSYDSIEPIRGVKSLMQCLKKGTYCLFGIENIKRERYCVDCFRILKFKCKSSFQDGVPMALVTNASNDNANAMLSKVDLKQFFDESMMFTASKYE